MFFKDFFQEEAGYDAPFDNEVDVLRKIQSLDPASLAQIDIGLHQKAVNQQRFTQSGNVDLVQDVPSKQRLVQILRGEITNPEQIQQTLVDLYKGQKRHFDYLKQPPDPNTGSHIWHRAWGRVYQAWIKELTSLLNKMGPQRTGEF